MYYIRADANEKIGTGHVMRCLSIAAEFHRRGRQVTFIIADDHSRTMIEEHDFSVICLDSDWDCLEKEIPSLISIIKTNTIPSLLIDSYFVTEFYLQALGKYTKTIYIDDLNRFIYPVDLLVNYNIYAADLEYPSRYKKSVLNTRFLLGCKYIPLREEFQNVKRTISKNVCKILVTSGGTDNYNVIGNLLEAFSKQTWLQMLTFM